MQKYFLILFAEQTHVLTCQFLYLATLILFNFIFIFTIVPCTSRAKYYKTLQHINKLRPNPFSQLNYLSISTIALEPIYTQLLLLLFTSSDYSTTFNST